MTALEQGDFATAGQWCRKSLAIKEKHGNEEDAAITYHYLGVIAQDAERLRGSAAVVPQVAGDLEKQGDEHGAAMTYHQLGMIAEERRDFTAAEQWYRKALAIWVKYGDRHYETITRSLLERLREAAGQESTSEQGNAEAAPSS